jgi:hypothetical protein
VLTDLFDESELRAGVLCKAISRHMFDGNIWQSDDGNGGVIWTEDFECEFCLTVRLTPLEPDTAAAIGGRQYRYRPEYDKTIRNQDARRLLIQRLFQASNAEAQIAIRS